MKIKGLPHKSGGCVPELVELNICEIQCFGTKNFVVLHEDSKFDSWVEIPFVIVRDEYYTIPYQIFEVLKEGYSGHYTIERNIKFARKGLRLVKAIDKKYEIVRGRVVNK